MTLPGERYSYGHLKEGFGYQADTEPLPVQNFLFHSVSYEYVSTVIY